jgi:hypothetical protein
VTPPAKNNVSLHDCCEVAFSFSLFDCSPEWTTLLDCDRGWFREDDSLRDDGSRSPFSSKASTELLVIEIEERRSFAASKADAESIGSSGLRVSSPCFNCLNACIRSASDAEDKEEEEEVTSPLLFKTLSRG